MQNKYNELEKIMKSIVIMDSIEICNKTKFMEESKFLKYIESFNVTEIYEITLKMIQINNIKDLKKQLFNNNKKENIKLM